jgi:S1-C subfamily serine protease
MLSAIFTKNSDANIGINFAVSARLLKALLKLKTNSAEATWRNSSLRLVPYPIRGQSGKSGAQILFIEANSKAEKTGLQVGDILLRAGQRRIKIPSDFKTELAVHEQDIMPILILRNNVDMQLNWHFQNN